MILLKVENNGECTVEIDGEREKVTAEFVAGSVKMIAGLTDKTPLLLKLFVLKRILDAISNEFIDKLAEGESRR